MFTTFHYTLRAALKHLLNGESTTWRPWQWKDLTITNCGRKPLVERLQSKFAQLNLCTSWLCSRSEWRIILADYRGGVDYPISFFYKEIMEVYPNAKVLLNVRDPTKWYESVHGSILKLMNTVNTWPCTWFTSLISRRESMSLVNALSRPIPKCSTMGELWEKRHNLFQSDKPPVYITRTGHVWCRFR